MAAATKQQIEFYIGSQGYASGAEYIFKNSPEVGVFRHSDNHKWFAVFMTISYEKLGLHKSGSVDILNLKCLPPLAAGVVDKKCIFPAYHMNKTHWISVLLDGSADMENIVSLIDLSFHLTSTRN